MNSFKISRSVNLVVIPALICLIQAHALCQEPKLAKPREIVLPKRFSSTGSPVFTSDSSMLLFFDGKGIRTYDLAKEEYVNTIEPGSRHFMMSPDGKKLAIDRDDHLNRRGELVIQIYELATNKFEHKLQHPDKPDPIEPTFRSCGFDSTNTKLFTRTETQLQVWEVATGKMLRRIEVPKRPEPCNPQQTPDGKYLRFKAADGVYFLETKTEKYTRIVVDKYAITRAIGRPSGGIIYSVSEYSMTGDGKRVFAVDQLNNVLLEWQMPQAKAVGGTRIPGITFANVSSDGTRLLAVYYGENETSLGVLDSKSLRAIAMLGPFADHISNFKISPDNRWVFSTIKGDGHLWDFGVQKSTVKKK